VRVVRAPNPLHVILINYSWAYAFYDSVLSNKREHRNKCFNKTQRGQNEAKIFNRCLFWTSARELSMISLKKLNRIPSFEKCPLLENCKENASRYDFVLWTGEIDT